MIIALDIDGTISEHPQLFAALSRSFTTAGDTVLILTYRDPANADRTIQELQAWGIQFDEVIYSPSLEAKGEICERLGVNVFFDDQDECLCEVPESVLSLKIRNGGNFDFEEKKWLSTEKLTRLI